jgi:hypothetical protein
MKSAVYSGGKPGNLDLSLILNGNVTCRMPGQAAETNA